MKHSKLLALVMAIAMIVSMVVTTGVTTVSADDVLIAANTASAEENPVAGLDVITLDFSKDGNWAACAFVHPEYGTAYYNNYRQSDDGESVEVLYQETTQICNYTFSAYFREDSAVQYDPAYQYVRILYSAKPASVGSNTITLRNNAGTSDDVCLVDEVTDTNGKFVLSDTVKINDGISERYARNSWCAILLGSGKNMSDDGELALKAMYFFKTEAEANKAGYASDKLAEALKIKKKLELLQSLVFLVGKNKPVEPEEPWVPEDCVALTFGSGGTGRLFMDAGYDAPTLVDDYYVLDSAATLTKDYSAKPFFTTRGVYTAEYKYGRILYAAEMPDLLGSVTLYGKTGKGLTDTLIEKVYDTNGGFVLSNTFELDNEAGDGDNFATRLATNNSNFIGFHTSVPGCVFKIKAIYFFKTKEAADEMFDVISMTFDTEDKTGTGEDTLPANEGTAPVLDKTDGSYTMSGTPNLTLGAYNNTYGFKPNFTTAYLAENPFNTDYRYVRVTYSADIPEGTAPFKLVLARGSGSETVTIATIRNSTNGFVVSEPIQLAAAGSNKIIDMLPIRGSNFLAFMTSQTGCTFKVQGIHFFKTLDAAQGFESIYDPTAEVAEPVTSNNYYTYYFGDYDKEMGVPADKYVRDTVGGTDGIYDALVSNDPADGYAVSDSDEGLVLKYASNYAQGNTRVVDTSTVGTRVPVDGVCAPIFRNDSRYYARLKCGSQFDTSYKWLVVEYAASMPADASTTLVVARGDGGGVGGGVALKRNVVDTNGEYVYTYPVDLTDTAKFKVFNNKDWATRFKTTELTFSFLTKEQGYQFTLKTFYFFKTIEEAIDFVGVDLPEQDLVTMNFSSTNGNAAWRTQTDWGYGENSADGALLIKCGEVYANREAALKYYWPFYEYVTGAKRPTGVPKYLPEFIKDETSPKGYKMLTMADVNADPSKYNKIYTIASADPKDMTSNGLTYATADGNGYGNNNFIQFVQDFYINFDPEACGCVDEHGNVDGSKVVPANATNAHAQLPGTNDSNTTMMAKIIFKTRVSELANYPYMRVLYELKLPEGVTSATLRLRNDGIGKYFVINEKATTTTGYVLSAAVQINEATLTRLGVQGNHCSLEVITSKYDKDAYLKVKGIYFMKDDTTIPNAALPYIS